MYKRLAIFPLSFFLLFFNNQQWVCVFFKREIRENPSYLSLLHCGCSRVSLSPSLPAYIFSKVGGAWSPLVDLSGNLSYCFQSRQISVRSQWYLNVRRSCISLMCFLFLFVFSFFVHELDCSRLDECAFVHSFISFRFSFWTYIETKKCCTSCFPLLFEIKCLIILCTRKKNLHVSCPIVFVFLLLLLWRKEKKMEGESCQICLKEEY